MMAWRICRPALVAVTLSACVDLSGPEVVGGVNLDVLFAEPSSREIDATLEDWASRDVVARDIAHAATATVSVSSTAQVLVRVLSHTVGGARHFGAIVVPAGAAPASLPIVLVGHPGDEGIDLDQALQLLASGFSGLLRQYVLVIPSFRSETLVFHATNYLSGGPASPWDGDVDDALALLNVAIATTPEADTLRIGALGFSRGATVALLAGVRDPRIAAVVEFSGATDFLGSFARGIVKEALLGRPSDLPGVATLNAQFIEPLARGERTIEDVRSQLVRRSPVYFALSLPAVQLHHGTADSLVPVSEAERLTRVMHAAERLPPRFESYLYPGGGHDPLTLTGSLDRAAAFLQQWLAAPPAAARAERRLVVLHPVTTDAW